MSTIGIVRMYVIATGLIVTGGHGVFVALGYTQSQATVACIGASVFLAGTIPDKWSRVDREASGE